MALRLNLGAAQLELIPADAATLADADEFERWYLRYPHKVGRASAKAAFIRARRKATFAELVAGLDRYIASKPKWQAYCNPATFLNQERWCDAPAADSHRAPVMDALNDLARRFG